MAEPMSKENISFYNCNSSVLGDLCVYLVDVHLLEKTALLDGNRWFEFAWGNGSIAGVLAQYGWKWTEFTPSTQEISRANALLQHLKFFKATVFDMIIPSANAIVLTQYYGFWKLLLMAVTPKLAEHYTHRYIKFWSIKSLVQMLREVGSFDIRFERVGRIPILAKSMIAIERTA